MKSLIVLMSLFSLSAFGAETTVSTNCDPFDLNPQTGTAQVSLYKHSALKSEQPFEISVYDLNRTTKEIKGLNVSTIKSVLVDKVERNVGSIAGSFHILTKVYGVKIHVVADEVIGHLIAGCIPVELKELDTYAICKENHTTKLD